MLRIAFCTAAAVVGITLPGACRDVGSPTNGSNGNGIPSVADALVVVDTTRRFQTITGWEAVAQAGQARPGFRLWQDDLLDKAVNELGLNRLRVHVYSGSEHTRDYYVRMLTGQSDDERCERWQIQNDNSDPLTLDPTRFRFSEIDSAMVNVVIPMKQRLEARGEKLFLNLNYVAFIAQCQNTPLGDYVHSDPAEYAELILAAFRHLKERYGFVPDALEVVLEPDGHGSKWNGTSIGRAILRTADVLSRNGFQPRFIAPSTTSMANAVTWSREMLAVSGVAPLVSELSYHRYGGVSEENLAALSEVAAANGTATSMLEHIGSGADQLYEDLTIGNAAAWQQFALGLGTGDGGGQYYQIIDNRAVMATRTKYLRQYFHYVRMGARRIEAKAEKGDIRPVAFRNTNGRLVVVIHTRGPGSIEIRGIAPGRYGATATTSETTGSSLGEQTVGSSGSIVVQAPGEGVLTVFRK